METLASKYLYRTLKGSIALNLIQNKIHRPSPNFFIGLVDKDSECARRAQTSGEGDDDGNSVLGISAWSVNAGEAT